MIFGITTDTKKYDIINHCILYAKQYIHRQFVTGKTLNTNNFIQHYKYILLIERERYITKGQLNKFEARFGKCRFAENIVL